MGTAAPATGCTATGQGDGATGRRAAGAADPEGKPGSKVATQGEAAEESGEPAKKKVKRISGRGRGTGTASSAKRQDFATAPATGQESAIALSAAGQDNAAATPAKGFESAAATPDASEPHTTSVFLKVIEPTWAEDVAAGQKMFECVANKKSW